MTAADGSHLRLFVRNAAEAAASPDGRQIAFVRGRAIWSMRRDGSGQRKLTQPGIAPGTTGQLADHDPAWTPVRAALARQSDAPVMLLCLSSRVWRSVFE